MEEDETIEKFNGRVLDLANESFALGFGHYQAECATSLKRKKKAFVTTLSDDESSSDSDCEIFGRALVSSLTENPIEEPTKITEINTPKTTHSDLEEVLSMWEEDQKVLNQQQEKIMILTKENLRLMEKISELKDELKNAKKEYDTLNKSVRMLSLGTSTLDEILSKEKVKNDKKGIGYSKGEFSKTKSTVFVCA
ncbi:putative envelope-like protein [Cucumis melo var. makuwa]|uniref:Putative envelope-like protein n=1 Tax=Cucumis melo var. makuwa TaxID=1194695 RepID=A0A5D3BQY7_CUCMM|nr:putative envelope-like protein [Cucumis melo var. makuwa]